MISHRLIAVLLIELWLIRAFLFGMMAVEKLYDVESAFVDIEVDIPRLKVRCAGLPYERFGIQPLDFPPRGLSDPFAVDLGINKQELQFIVLRFFVRHRFRR